MSTLLANTNVATASNTPDANVASIAKKTATHSKAERGRPVTKPKKGQISTAPPPSTERFIMSDTSPALLVAPNATIAIHKQKNVFAAPLSGRQFPDQFDITEAEGYAIEALRRYQAANTNPALLANLQAWEGMQMFVDAYHEEQFTYNDAIEHKGEDEGATLFAAVVTVAQLFPMFLPPNARQEAAATETTDANEESATKAKATKTAKHDKTKKGMLNPSPGQQRSVLEYLDQDIADLKQSALRASKSRKAYADYNAWQWLQSVVYGLDNGQTPSAYDFKENPKGHATAAVIYDYIKSERRKTLDAAQELPMEQAHAQQSPTAHAESQAFEFVKDGLSDAKRGGDVWNGEDGARDVLNMTTQEAAAFEVVAAYWKRTTRNMARHNKAKAK